MYVITFLHKFLRERGKKRGLLMLCLVNSSCKMHYFDENNRDLNKNRFIWTINAPSEVVVGRGQKPEDLEKKGVRVDSEEKRESLGEKVEAKEKLLKQYQALKRDPRAFTAEQVQAARIEREEGEDIFSDKEKREAAEYDQELVGVLQSMTLLINREAARRLLREGKKNFTFEDITEKAYDIIEKWGLEEARDDILTYYGTQAAVYDIVREGLGGEEFEKLSPSEMWKKVQEVYDVEGLPGEIRSRIRDASAKMPPGMTLGPLQGPIESLMDDRSLGKGSVLLKGATGVAGVMAVTGVLANIIAPVFRSGMKIMSNITNPRKAVQELRKEVVNTAKDWRSSAKKIGGTGLIAASFLLLSSNDPLGKLKGIRDTIVDTTKGAAKKTKEVAEGAWERATETTPSHIFVNKMIEQNPDKKSL
jgi:hypothetical protein